MVSCLFLFRFRYNFFFISFFHVQLFIVIFFLHLFSTMVFFPFEHYNRFFFRCVINTASNASFSYLLVYFFDSFLHLFSSSHVMQKYEKRKKNIMQENEWKVSYIIHTNCQSYSIENNKHKLLRINSIERIIQKVAHKSTSQLSNMKFIAVAFNDNFCLFCHSFQQIIIESVRFKFFSFSFIFDFFLINCEFDSLRLFASKKLWDIYKNEIQFTANKII